MQQSFFFIAPFSIDGRLQGVQRLNVENLSAKWLDICGRRLASCGKAFEGPWKDNLSHIQMKFTSSAGVALITFSIRGHAVSSVFLSAGLSVVTETDVMKMFIESLRKVDFVTRNATLSNPFQEILTISERPVMIVVPWPDKHVTEDDHGLVRELAIHTAGAFFCGCE